MTRAHLITTAIAAACAVAMPADAQRVVRPPASARPAAPEKAAAPTAKPASAAPAAAGRTRGTYRVSVTGFSVHSETFDDPLQLDGKRDEVYVSADVLLLDRNGASLTPGTGAVRSRVFGDVGGMFGGTEGHNGRVRAGSASKEGGLRTGDDFPATPWRLAGAPTADRLPLELWRGELAQGENAVLLTPTLWEFDQPDLRETYRSWQEWGGRTARQLGGSRELMAFLATALGPEAPVIVNLSGLGYDLTLSVANELGKMGDRPIGMEPVGELQGERGAFTFKPKTVLLSFDMAERLLSQNVGGKGPGVVAIPYTERHPKLNGNYTMYLLVERLR